MAHRSLLVNISICSRLILLQLFNYLFISFSSDSVNIAVCYYVDSESQRIEPSHNLINKP